ncbi:MAG: hypothetical protein KGI88_07950 [Betaproteobacteria bacterium]|nr:hypothetical protein [Betaproteobacteria bacterium]
MSDIATGFSKEELQQLVKDTVALTIKENISTLSDDEITWVRMAIKAEADRAALRKAIIEKTLSSLIWAAVAGVGTLLFKYISEHWKV